MRYKRYQENTKLQRQAEQPIEVHVSQSFKAIHIVKTCFWPVLRPGPHGGTYDTPADLLVGWGGDNLPDTFPILMPRFHLCS